MSQTHDTRDILWHTIPATDYHPGKLIARYFITNSLSTANNITKLLSNWTEAHSKIRGKK